MDRRGFLMGAGALGLAACAQPERQLLDAYDGAAITLEPGATRTPTTGAPSDNDPNRAADAASSPDPVSIPEEDLAGLVFVAEASIARMLVYQSRHDADPAWIFDNPIPSGGPLVFQVEEFDGMDAFRVLLPTRPNGTFGWIQGSTARLTRHNFAIRVDLDNYELTLFDHLEPVFSALVGVARDNTPTPQGRYYTTELLRPPTAHTIYGAYAYGLSGYSEVLTSFAGGDGQLGIHGTIEPETLGTNVSAGCIRLHDDDITYLVEEVGLPIGVPVEVV